MHASIFKVLRCTALRNLLNFVYKGFSKHISLHNSFVFCLILLSAPQNTPCICVHMCVLNRFSDV